MQMGKNDHPASCVVSTLIPQTLLAIYREGLLLLSIEPWAVDNKL